MEDTSTLKIFKQSLLCLVISYADTEISYADTEILYADTEISYADTEILYADTIYSQTVSLGYISYVDSILLSFYLVLKILT
jgi:hypothetical protein